MAERQKSVPYALTGEREENSTTTEEVWGITEKGDHVGEKWGEKGGVKQPHQSFHFEVTKRATRQGSQQRQKHQVVGEATVFLLTPYCSRRHQFREV